MKNFMEIMIVANIIIALVCWGAKKQEKANWHLLLAILLAVGLNAG